MNYGKKLIALVTVFLMIFGNIPLIALADDAHPYVYSGSLSSRGTVKLDIGSKTTARINLHNEITGANVTAYCADEGHTLRNEHFSIAPLTNGYIRALMHADVSKYANDIDPNMTQTQITAALQAAIWNRSDDTNLAASGNDADVVALYNKLLNEGTMGTVGLPATATATLEPTGTATYNANGTINVTFRFKSSDSSVTLTPTVNRGTLGTVTTSGDWKLVTVSNIPVDHTFTITVTGSQTKKYDACYFIPESRDGSSDGGQILVGFPADETVSVTNSVTFNFGSLRVKKAFTETTTSADTSSSFTVNIKGGPSNCIDLDVSVPGTGAWKTVAGLPYGNYTVSESIGSGQAATYGFVSIVNSETSNTGVVINSSGTTNGDVTATNRQLGSLTIHKELTPADTTEFTFNITGPDFPAGGTDFKLADNGSKQFDGLRYGTYTVTEKSTAGYRLVNFTGDGTASGAGRSVVIDGTHRSLSITANNEKLTTLVIRKTDSVTHGPVSGVVFHVTGPSFDKTLTTGDTGILTESNLLPGTYVVTEISAPAGYRVNNTSAVSQTVAAGGTVTFDFSDDPIGKLNIIKQDLSGNLLPGAIFWVSLDPNFGTYTVLDTGANSSIMTGDLIAGSTYHVREVKAPAGYVIPSENTQHVTVVQGVTTPVTFKDPKDEGSLLIKKVSAYNSIPVAGVEFQVSKNAGFTSLVTLPNGGKTDANGELLVQHLTPGQYWVREVTPAPGYSIDTTVVHNVTVMFNQTYNVPQFVNWPLGKVKVVKHDAYDDSVLAGAVFGVYSDAACTTLVDTLAATTAGGTAISKELPFNQNTTYYVKEISAPSGYAMDSRVQQAKFTTAGQTVELTFTNARTFGSLTVRKALESFTGDTTSFNFTIVGPSYPSGFNFSLSNGQERTFNHLDFGTYTITETANLPYKRESFTGGNGSMQGASYVVSLNSGNQGYTVIANNRHLGSLNITKALQEGVTGDTTPFNFTISGPGFAAPEAFTLAAGQNKSFPNLEYGDYTITELPAADGYRLNGFSGGNGTAAGSAYTVTVGATNLDLSVTCSNLKLGKLEVVKTDSADGSYLAGAIFGIYSEAACTHLVATMTATGANGHAVSGWLAPATYWVKELTAPDGYRIDSTTAVQATVDAGETALLPAFTDTKDEGWIRVTKLDRQTGAKVAGVKFQLLDKNPNTDPAATVLQEEYTDKDGIAQFLHLTPGTTYFVRETLQAPGYSIDITDVRNVTVVFNEPADVEFQNDEIGDFTIVKVDTNDHSKYLAGAEFQVSASATDFSDAFTLVTKADGKVTSDKLVVGTWYVKETKAPNGYAIDDTSVRTVTVAQFETAMVDFYDTKLYGSAMFYKVIDNASNDGTVFTLNITGDNGYENSVSVCEIGAPAFLDDLPFGTYTVTEDAKDGYTTVGITPAEFTIDAGSYQARVNVEATNHKLMGKAIFSKVVDNIDNDPATFTLNITGDNGYTNSVTVGEAIAPVTIDDLPFGTYTVTEADKTGYSLVGFNRTSFTIDSDNYLSEEPIEVTATNHKLLGKAIFSKVVDNIESDPTTFTLNISGDNGYTNSVTVGESIAPVTLDDLPFGTYTVTEADKEGYSLVGIELSTFTIDEETYSGSPIAVVATNHKQLGSAVFSKVVNNIDDDPATFTLNISGDNGYTNSVTVGEAIAPVTLSDLPLGNYTVTEAAKSGYENMSIDHNTFTVSSSNYEGAPVQVVATNHKLLGKAIFSKVVDNIDNDPATFTLNISGDNGYTNSVTVGEAIAPVTLDDLPFGNYTVTEANKTGYSLVGIELSTFTIDEETYSGDPITVVATNHKLLGSAVFSKVVDNIENDPATFTLNIVGDNGYTNSVTVGEATAPVKLSDLPFGTYTVTEAAKDGYVPVGIEPSTFTINENNYAEVAVSVIATNHKILGSATFSKVVDNIVDDPTTFTLNISGDNGYTNSVTVGEAIAPVTLSDLTPGTYTVTETAKDGYALVGITPSTFTINAENYQAAVTVTATNHSQFGFIQAKKADSAAPATYLEGAVFKISTSKDAFDANVVETITTGVNGLATSGKLPLGTYWIKETTAPAGYVIDNAQPVEVVVSEQDTTYLVNFTDTKDVGSLKILKVSTLDGKPVKGVQFEVASDEAFTHLLQADPYTTDENGLIVINNLPTGSVWWVREVNPAPNYNIDRALKQSVTVAFGATVQVRFENSPVGKVRVTKLDAADETVLAGAIYGVYSDPECTKLVDTLAATDATGVALSSELPFGAQTIYYVKEITAPTGYLLNTQIQQASFTEPGQIVELTFSNTKNIGAIVIQKVDKLNPQLALAGAEFSLFSDEAEQNLIAKGTTGADGMLRFDNLVPGFYYLRETKAPKDYDLATEHFKLEAVVGTENAVTVVIKDQYNPPKDFQTGMMDWNILLIGGLALMAGLMLVIFSRKRRATHTK